MADSQRLDGATGVVKLLSANTASTAVQHVSLDCTKGTAAEHSMLSAKCWLDPQQHCRHMSMRLMPYIQQMTSSLPQCTPSAVSGVCCDCVRGFASNT